MGEKVDPRRAQVDQVGGRVESYIFRSSFGVVTHPTPSPQSALGGLVPVRPSEARAVKLMAPRHSFKASEHAAVASSPLGQGACMAVGSLQNW